MDANGIILFFIRIYGVLFELIVCVIQYFVLAIASWVRSFCICGVVCVRG